MAENERQFEENIEKYLISPAGGYEKADDSSYRAYVDMVVKHYGQNICQCI